MELGLVLVELILQIVVILFYPAFKICVHLVLDWYLAGQPRQKQRLLRRDPLLRLSNQGRQEELSKIMGLLCTDLILDLKNDLQRVVAEIREALHGSILLEVLLLLGTPGNEMRMERPNQLLYLGQVVLVFAPVLASLGVEEQIASEHFVHHAAEGPQIRRLVVALA